MLDLQLADKSRLPQPTHSLSCAASLKLGADTIDLAGSNLSHNEFKPGTGTKRIHKTNPQPKPDHLLDLLPLPSHSGLEQAVSRVTVPGNWKAEQGQEQILKLVHVLLDTPTDLDLSTIPELPDYVRKVFLLGTNLPFNLLRWLVTHCFRMVHGMYIISCPYTDAHIWLLSSCYCISYDTARESTLGTNPQGTQTTPEADNQLEQRGAGATALEGGNAT